MPFMQLSTTIAVGRRLALKSRANTLDVGLSRCLVLLCKLGVHLEWALGVGACSELALARVVLQLGVVLRLVE